MTFLHTHKISVRAEEGELGRQKGHMHKISVREEEGEPGNKANRVPRLADIGDADRCHATCARENKHPPHP